MDKQTLVGVGEWIIDTSSQLGKGSYGNVFVCYREADPSKKFAAKKIPLSNNKKDTEKINTELRIFNKVNSPYVVQMHAFKKTQNSVYIFMDLCIDGSLRGYVEKHGKLQASTAIDFFQKLCIGYKDLREQKVLHRDLKPDNVLIDNGTPKLTDFGLGRIFEDIQELSQNQTKSLVGSEYYMAPELLEYVKIAYQNGQLTEKPHYTDKSDVWSMGMVFYYMLVGQKPWVYENNTQSYINNIKQKPILIDQSWPLLIQHVLIRMLTINDNDRISWDDVFNHPAVNPQVLNSGSINIEQLANNCVQNIQSYMAQYPQQNQQQLNFSNAVQQLQQQIQQQQNNDNQGAGSGPSQQSVQQGYVPMKVGGDDTEMEMEDD